MLQKFPKAAYVKDQEKDLLSKIKPKHIFIDKEQLYQENIKLKLKNHSLLEEILKLKTKNIQIENELNKKETAKDSTQGYEAKNSNLVQGLKKIIKDLKFTLQTREAEVNKFKSNLKGSRVNELEIEVQAYIDECTRLRHHLEEMIKSKQFQSEELVPIQELQSLKEDNMNLLDQYNESAAKIKSLKEKLDGQKNIHLKKPSKITQKINFKPKAPKLFKIIAGMIPRKFKSISKVCLAVKSAKTRESLYETIRLHCGKVKLKHINEVFSIFRISNPECIHEIIKEWYPLYDYTEDSQSPLKSRSKSRMSLLKSSYKINNSDILSAHSSKPFTIKEKIPQVYQSSPILSQPLPPIIQISEAIKPSKSLPLSTAPIPNTLKSPGSSTGCKADSLQSKYEDAQEISLKPSVALKANQKKGFPKPLDPSLNTPYEDFFRTLTPSVGSESSFDEKNAEIVREYLGKIAERLLVRKKIIRDVSKSNNSGLISYKNFLIGLDNLEIADFPSDHISLILKALRYEESNKNCIHIDELEDILQHYGVPGSPSNSSINRNLSGSQERYPETDQKYSEDYESNNSQNYEDL